MVNVYCKVFLDSREYREKTVLGYGDNDTITYMLKKNFVFDIEASNGLTEDDEVVVINFGYMVIYLSTNHYQWTWVQINLQ